MIVSVTKKDIANGIRDSAICCPVALAVNRRTKSSSYVMPHAVWIGWNRYELPKRVTSWILDYDYGKAVKPIRFTI